MNIQFINPGLCLLIQRKSLPLLRKQVRRLNTLFSSGCYRLRSNPLVRRPSSCQTNQISINASDPVHRLNRCFSLHSPSHSADQTTIFRNATTSSSSSTYGPINASTIGGPNLDPAASRDVITDEDISEGLWKSYLSATDEETEQVLAKDMLVFPEFLSLEEEASLLNEVQPVMKRLRYEYAHWDNAIHGYRETERSQWSEENQGVLQRVRDLAFPPGVPQIAHVHVLDISDNGYIKPHVDAVRFCGNTIAGLCLMSSCVMRLAWEKDPSRFGDILLTQRSLYIMRHRARYEFTHEVLSSELSMFRGQAVPRDRRISVICRNLPEGQPDDQPHEQ